MTEDQAAAFLKAVDGVLPAEIGGLPLCTDRVLVPTSQDAVVMQAYNERGLSLFISATGREVNAALARGNITALAVRRVQAALERAA